jgi:hypothetical protein
MNFKKSVQSASSRDVIEEQLRLKIRELQDENSKQKDDNSKLREEYGRLNKIQRGFIVDLMNENSKLKERLENQS